MMRRLESPESPDSLRAVRSTIVHIVFCDTCGKRVPESELPTATIKSGATGKVFCSNCHPAQPKHASVSARSVSKAHEKISVRKHAPDAKVGFVGGVATVAVAAVIGFALLHAKSGASRRAEVAITNVEKTETSAEPPPSRPQPSEPPTVTGHAPVPVPLPIPTPVAPPQPQTGGDTPPRRSQPDFDLNAIAAKYLADAKALRATDLTACKEKLLRIVNTYQSTPSFAEATRLLKELNDVPAPQPPPAPPERAAAPVPERKVEFADNKDATPVFDGKTLACLDPDCLAAWKIDNGAIVSAGTEYSNAQSRADFSDGVLRFRFENTAADEISFEVRQGTGSQFRIAFSKAECAALAGKPHELLIACDGATVTATLDGNAATVSKPAAPPRTGRFRFAADHGTLRMLNIDLQKLPAK